MIRWVRLLLKGMGFDVCPHSYSTWRDEYTHSYVHTRSGEVFNTYSESQKEPHTHLRQTRRCDNCNQVQIRHTNLKKFRISIL